MIIPEKKCKELYKSNLWVNFFTNVRFITGSFIQLEKLVPKKGQILDLGCGYGILSNYLALSSSDRKIIGVDTDKVKIKYANHGLKNVSLNIGDATKMNLKNLDCIILHDVLHHLNSYTEQEKLVGNCKKMLSKNGVLLVIEVDRKPLWKWILGRMTDFTLYKGSPVFYLYREKMLSLLTKYFSIKSVKIQKFYKNPFPQVGYICKKN